MSQPDAEKKSRDLSFAARIERRLGKNINPEISLDPAPDTRAQTVSTGVLKKLSAHAPRITRYRTLGEVARGGMGAILKVWDADLRRNLAMKILLAREDDGLEGASSEDREASLLRFLEEAQITGQLDHPNIVPVHELGLDEAGRVYFTMRLIRGRNLKEIFDLVHEGKEGWSRTGALSVLLKVCEAMAYAHSKGVIHRDLKPANIMVGRFGEVYVMDWGVAKVMGREDNHDLRVLGPEAALTESIRTERMEVMKRTPDTLLYTMDGDLLGTPAYMSPEQARGEVDQMDRRTDVYALGAMLYHLLTGRMPYMEPGVGLDGCTVWRWLLEGPPKPVHELAPDVPPELEAICDKAMARDRSDRYADMMEVAEDLRAYLENRVVSAYRTGPVVEFRKWVRRNRALASTIALGLLLMLFGAVATSIVLAAKNRKISFARDEAEKAAARAGAINTFLVREMLMASTPDVAMGREITVKEVLDNAASRVESALEGQGEVEAAVRHTLGNAYWRLGRVDEAARHLSQALEHRRTFLGENHRDTLETQCNLAWTLLHKGETARGEALLRDGLERQREILGEEDPDTLATVDMVGDMITRMGRPGEAEPIFRKNLDVRRRVLGEDHVTTLGTWHKLAHVIKLQGRMEETETLMRTLLERKRRILSDNHPDTVAAINDMAALLHDLGRLEEAEAFYQEALDGTRRVYGEEHPMYAVALNNMGTFLMDKAAKEMKPELRAEAEANYRLSLEIRRKAYSEDHPVVATGLHNLGGLLHAWGRDDEAEAMINKALEIRTKRLGPEHEETILSLYCLAVVQFARDKIEEAESSFREALESVDRSLSPDHWRRGSFRMGFGKFLLEEKRHDEAEGTLLEAYRILTESLGRKHPSTRETVSVLIRLYEDWRKPEQAARWRGKL